MPSRPSSPTSNSSPPTSNSSPPPSNHEVTWLLLETLNTHQAATKRPISPENDIQNLEQLGTSDYILTLLKEVEPTLPSPPSRNLTLERRVKRIQDHYQLAECPQYERPNLKASEALIQLQHSQSLSADYENWSPDEPRDEAPLHALFFASRAFGGLCCKLPPDMSHEDPCLLLLVPLCERHDQLLNNTLKSHDKQDTKDLFLIYDLFV
ncbi:hypothetical protein CEP52_017801 [Fusarium oligoseptatum]|uniref:Uncharacterized protein n=1 Tax=Fusarium oligoseptatum TaxID=2604345 RepID=A0A428RFA7_9HYPO|nr:hypothetical protein CEP52_017801 [Fusarium oligoseptatum]